MDNSIFEPISEDVISSIMEAPGDENEGGNDNNVDLAADDNTNNDNQNADDNNADNDTDENNDQDQENQNDENRGDQTNDDNFDIDDNDQPPENDEGDNDNGREHDAERGDHAADGSGELIPDKCRGVDGDDAGGALADGVIIHQLLFRCPAVTIHDLPLQNGDHGVAAAEGHGPDARKGQEQLPQCFHLLKLST